MKLGRPKIAASEQKKQITGVRLRVAERKLVEKAAAICKQKLSDWIRETLLQRASRQLRRAL
jgi:uncharacterized protein (DUF1778 family)